MPSLNTVAVDLAQGLVCFGERRVSLQADGEGFRAPDGPRLRSIKFGERSRAVAAALAQGDQRRFLLSALRVLAAAGESHELSDALLLALAGGGVEAPPFAECARTACRNHSLDWNAVQQTSALIVDRMAAQSVATGSVEGWTRFEFQAAAEKSPEIREFCDQMLDRLLARGIESEPAVDATRVAPSSRRLRARVRIPGAVHQVSESSQPLTLDAQDAAPIHAGEIPFAAPPDAEFGTAFDEPSAPEVASQPMAVGESAWTSATTMPVSRSRDSSLLSSKTESATAAIARPRARVRLQPMPLKGQSDGASVAQPAIKFQRQPEAQPLRSHWDFAAVNPAPSLLEPLAARALVPAASVPLAEIRPAAATRPRDWLYEIARALSDECDLRGLDA